jgi:uncharacterized membrane protein
MKKGKPGIDNGNRSLMVIWVAGIVGFIDASYLTLTKFTKAPLYCTPGLGDCHTVNASRWSELWGIPIAAFGLTAYAIVILVLLLSKRSEWVNRYQNLILFALSFTGFLYSVYLTYLELFVIRAICQWCMLSALSITVIMIAAITRLKFQRPILLKQGGK